MSEPELKPCPFCGDKEAPFVSFTSEWNVDLYSVRCEECDCQGPRINGREAAIADWNSRYDLERAGNRSPDRYALPPELGNRDITLWLAGKPFFLASAIKYIWRGWDHADDLRKALQCLELAYLHEVEQGGAFSLMWSDLMHIQSPGGRERALGGLLGVTPQPVRITIRGCSELVDKRVKELEGEGNG